MKYNHKLTDQILLLHRNNGRHGLHFWYFEGRKNAQYSISSTKIQIMLPRNYFQHHRMRELKVRHRIATESFREDRTYGNSGRVAFDAAPARFDDLNAAD
jgi:hypothetical protein